MQQDNLKEYSNYLRPMLISSLNFKAQYMIIEDQFLYTMPILRLDLNFISLQDIEIQYSNEDQNMNNFQNVKQKGIKLSLNLENNELIQCPVLQFAKFYEHSHFYLDNNKIQCFPKKCGYQKEHNQDLDQINNIQTLEQASIKANIEYTQD
ncbi:hypothetical protein PPERSA_07579 [Pseudocohnilembus persalinus]|uniref:Uncharacterized protein n=1 Tax=Pseudocohnilembus persalinus TaxID=266149 RepID=A0A0V0R0Z0_PSEPJ|nr:hypothetical protein PPERSA_07579 [Pseudocohnilembus persalinus]|eukprot:KRX07829.1 hypothetical protein PPERSA_07579 [Pseudocohnilembus persalinus]